MHTKENLLEQLNQTITTYCDTFFNFDFDAENPKVRLHEPTLQAPEVMAALTTLLSTYTTMGTKVRAFEKQYADYCGLQHGVMSNSGSSANLLAIAALANPLTPNYLKPGDEVIVPALSWSTTIWPLVQHQLTPVLVDCDLDSFNLSLAALEQAISPQTKAIQLVHVYGNPCEMEAIMEFAAKHQLIVIEDCCEAMGARYQNKSVGNFGQIANFSFFFSHHISTLEGGISVTNSFELTEMMRVLRAHGWSREADQHEHYKAQYPEIDPRFIFINQGYNLRPTELNAAIGQLQLLKLDDINRKRRENAAYFLKALNPYGDYFQFQQETAGSEHVWFGFPIVLKAHAPFSVKAITTFLNAHHVETRPIIAGNMARHPGIKLYPHRISGELTNADTIMKNGFAFACHHALTTQAREYIVNCIHEFMTANIASRFKEAV